jgi:hypothetical protein
MSLQQWNCGRVDVVACTQRIQKVNQHHKFTSSAENKSACPDNDKSACPDNDKSEL